MSTTYTITELAREFDITARAIRHYEDEGLLSPSRQGQSRIFTHRDRVRLKLALRGRRLGFTLAEIRELFDLYDLAKDENRQLREFLAKLEKRRMRLEQQREDIAVMLNEISFFESQCRKLLKEQEQQSGVRVSESSLAPAGSV
jgi:DNA-binding transcriptional MerR regulator